MKTKEAGKLETAVNHINNSNVLKTALNQHIWNEKIIFIVLNAVAWKI